MVFSRLLPSGNALPDCRAKFKFCYDVWPKIPNLSAVRTRSAKDLARIFGMMIVVIDKHNRLNRCA